MLTDSDLQALRLTARLAGVVTLILIDIPIVWWLARTKTWWKGPMGGCLGA